MKEFQRRKNSKKILTSIPILLLLTFIAGALLYSAGKMCLRAYRAVMISRAAKAEEVKVLAKKSAIEEDLRKLSTPLGTETEIRRRFNVKRPGERSLIVVEKGEGGDTLKATSTEGILPRLWRSLRGIF